MARVQVQDLDLNSTRCHAINDSEGSILSVTNLLYRVQVVNIFSLQHDFISNFKHPGGVMFIILSFLRFKGLVKV